TGGDDDGPALQRAIDSAGERGGIVRLESGVYRLRIRDGVRALIPRRNVRLIGAGQAQTILRLEPGQPAYKGLLYPEHPTDDLSGFGLQDLTVDQNAEGNPIRSAADLKGNARAVVIINTGSNI